MSTRSFARIGPYTVLGTIADGGMARVLLAQRDDDPTPCVLKQLHLELERHPTASLRFQREAMIASTLRHPNIARTLDCGVHEDRFYIAIEFIAGQTLADVLIAAREHSVPLLPSTAVAIMIAVLEGLGHAHEIRNESGERLDLVHRDLTPRNIMISYGGEVKLIDFGVAHARVEGDGFHTSPGVVLGTLAYLSPEQALAHEIDHRSDLYSAGAVLHELLSGRPLIGPVSPTEAIRRIVNDVPPRLRSCCLGLPHSLDEAVDIALSKKPEHRYQSAAEFREELLACGIGLPNRDELSRYMRQLFPTEERETSWVLIAAEKLHRTQRSATEQTRDSVVQTTPDLPPITWSIEGTDPEVEFSDDPTEVSPLYLSEHDALRFDAHRPSSISRPGSRALADEVRNIEPGGILEFSLRQLPLDEVLWLLHQSRFTGSLDLGGLPDFTRLSFRRGALVGLSPNPELDTQLLWQVLVKLNLLHPNVLEDLYDRVRALDADLLGSYLQERRLIDEQQLLRAKAEQSRRRLFLLFEETAEGARILEGDRHVTPTPRRTCDILPIVAYGTVVHSDRRRRMELNQRVRHKRVRTTVVLDQERNRLGLPPRVIHSIRALEGDGIDLGDPAALPGLNPTASLGVLLLLDRLSLLSIEERDTAALPGVVVHRRASSF